MELLYIWIEDYKNIHRQGFNFSPKYRFEFTPTEYGKDEQGNEIVTGGELTCKETDFPDNFFDKGISNVTAIVGENGSGKSTLLEFMQRELDNIHTKQTYLRIYKQKEKVIIYYLEDWILSNRTNIQDLQLRKYKIIQNNKSTNIVRGAGYDFEDFTYRVKFSIFFDVKYDYLGGRNQSNITTNYLLQQAISKYEQKGTRYHKLIELIKQITFIQNKRKISLPFYVTNTISISIEPISLFFSSELQNKLEILGLTNNVLKLSVQGLDIIEDGNKIFRFTRKLYNSFFNATIAYFLEKELDLSPFRNFKVDIENNNNMTTQVSAILHLLFKNISKEDTYNNIKEFIDNLLKLCAIENVISDNCDEVKLNIDNIEILLKKYQNIFFINPYLEFDWYEYSYGEKVLLNTFSRFFFLKDNIKTNDILIFIDEGELGLHPQWQKEYLKNLIDVLPKIFEGKQIQIILTSHSPFLVSDLPKENIIFLRKGQKEDKELENKCIVVKEGDRKHPQVTQTFGQNIHTLFADSFFMEGGLMGNFAKEKLEQAIKWLKSTEPLTENEVKELKFIISNFGEPMIKHKLEQLYEKKFLTKIDETLESKIERLKRELAEAENIQQQNKPIL